jgi:hypothetical protein
MYPQQANATGSFSATSTINTIAPPTPSVPEIHDVLQQQAKAVEYLHELLSQLENKAEAVLLPVPPVSASGTKDVERGYGSKVASQIAQHTIGINQGLARLRSITDRIAL